MQVWRHNIKEGVAKSLLKSCVCWVTKSDAKVEGWGAELNIRSESVKPDVKCAGGKSDISSDEERELKVVGDQTLKVRERVTSAI